MTEITHARVKFDDGLVKIIPIETIKQFQKTKPKNASDFDKKKLYKAEYRDSKNPDGVVLPVRISQLACGEAEAEKLSEKRGHFGRINESAMEEFNYDTSCASDGHESEDEDDEKVEKTKRKKTAKAAAAKLKKEENEILQQKISTFIQSEDNLMLSTSETNFQKHIGTPEDKNENTINDELRKKNQNLQLQYELSIDELNTYKKKCTELEDKLDSVQQLNIQLQQQYFAALDEKGSSKVKSSSPKIIPSTSAFHPKNYSNERKHPSTGSQRQCSTPINFSNDNYSNYYDSDLSPQKKDEVQNKSEDKYNSTPQKRLNNSVSSDESYSSKEKKELKKQLFKPSPKKQKREESDDNFLERFSKRNDAGEKIRMRNLGDGYEIEDEIWQDLYREKISIFTIGLIRHFYTPQELCKLSVTGHEKYTTPRGTHSRRKLSPKRKAVIERCYKSVVNKKSTATGKKKQKELNSVNKYFVQEINYVVMKQRELLGKEELQEVE